MLRSLRWSLPLQLPQRSFDAVVIPQALMSLVDDSARRLARAPEAPRRLDSLADLGVRTLCGRFPG